LSGALHLHRRAPPIKNELDIRVKTRREASLSSFTFSTGAARRQDAGRAGIFAPWDNFFALSVGVSERFFDEQGKIDARTSWQPRVYFFEEVERSIAARVSFDPGSCATNQSSHIHKGCSIARAVPQINCALL